VLDLEQETFANEELTVRNQEETKQTTASDAIKEHRFSALVDGVCMGIGFVFLILGVALPMMAATEMVLGLLMIIGAIVCVATGAIIEVYQWAKLK
jgi:formate/nitrite transporter FocA (FNT family)